MQVAQWASIYPHLLHNRHELPAESTSWLGQALQTIRDQYFYYPQPLSVEVQVLLWQAKEELGNLFEPDADTDIFDAVITQSAKSRVSRHSSKLFLKMRVLSRIPIAPVIWLISKTHHLSTEAPLKTLKADSWGPAMWPF